MESTTMAKLLIYLELGVAKLSDEELRDFHSQAANLELEILQERRRRVNTPTAAAATSPGSPG